MYNFLIFFLGKDRIRKKRRRKKRQNRRQISIWINILNRIVLVRTVCVTAAADTPNE